MRNILRYAGLLVLVAGGCASSRSLEQRAEDHQARADQLASSRHYEAAANEQHKADDLRRRAAERAYNQTTVTTPVAPPAEPVIPPPLDPTIP